MGNSMTNPPIQLDSIQKFMFEHRPIRGVFLKLGQSYERILKHQSHPTVIQTLLAECLLSSTLLNSLAKHPGTLSLQFEGKGALKLLSVRCTPAFKIRAYAKVESAKKLPSSLSKLLGEGQLMLTSLPEKDGPRYQSFVSVESDSVAEAMADYFTHSEQLPTAFFFAVDAARATGVLLQVMPQEDPEAMMAEWEVIKAQFQAIPQASLLEMSLEEVITQFLPEEEVRVFPAQSVEFGCTCHVEKMKSALVMSGPEEIKGILQDHPFVTVTCDFCGASYQFDEPAVQQIFLEKNYHAGTTRIT